MPSPINAAHASARRGGRSIAPVAAVLAIALLGGCRPGGDGSEGVVVRDSAGVRIVENGPAQLERAARWSVSPVPLVDIGIVEGPEEYRLFRVSDAMLLPDGVLLVNAGTGEVRRFDSAGAFVSAFGREGEGPGEFRAAMRVLRYRADSLAVWDERLRRLSVFTLGGAFQRQVRPERQAANPTLLCAFADGGFLLRDDRFMIPASGFADMQFTLVRYAADGAFEDSAGTYWYGEIGRLRDLDLVGGPTFGAHGAAAASDSGIWVGDGRAYEVRRRDAGGALVAIVRWAGPSRAVSSEDADAYWAGRMAGDSPDDRRRMERIRQALPVAEEFPAYQRLLAAPGGRLWVAAYRRPRDAAAPIWWVFDAGGELIATAAIPPRLRITDIGEGRVLGVERDSLGVERVRAYRLDRG